MQRAFVLSFKKGFLSTHIRFSPQNRTIHHSFRPFANSRIPTTHQIQNSTPKKKEIGGLSSAEVSKLGLLISKKDMFNIRQTFSRIQNETKWMTTWGKYEEVMSSLFELFSANPVDLLRQALVHECMRANGYADYDSYVKMISALSTAGLMKKAIALLDELETSKIAKSVSDKTQPYYAVAKGFMADKNYEKALEIVNRMQEVAPDNHTKNELMWVLLMKMNRPDDMAQMFETILTDIPLKSKHIANKSKEEREQYIIAYKRARIHELMNIMISNKRLEDALNLLGKLRSENCPPNSVTCSLLMQGYIENQDPAKALDIFQQFFKAHYELDDMCLRFAYGSLHSLNSTVRFISFFEETIQSGLMPSRVTFQVLLNHLKGKGLNPDDYIQKMDKRGFSAVDSNYEWRGDHIHRVKEKNADDFPMEEESSEQ